MVLVNGLDIPVQEISEELGRRTRRSAKLATALAILAAQTFHRKRPYPLLAALAGMSLGVAPYFIQAPNQAKIAMQGASVPLTLLAAQGLLNQAGEDEEAEDDREFRKDLNREAYRSAQAMELESQFLALQQQNYELLPLHVRPDRYDLTEFAKGQQSAGQQFMQGAEKAMKEAFADLPDDEGEDTELGKIALPTSKSATQFRELDLAAAAAQNDKSLLVSGVSGVGKTTFIRHVIHAINREYDGAQVFVGVDFKGSTGHFCGLERSQSFITSPAPGRDYKFAAEAIGNVVEMLGNRDEEFPLYLLCDEINNGLEQAKCQGNAYGRKPEETLKSNLKFIATQGRERNIRGILTAHGNLMGMLGIDGDTAQSLVCAVLGRKVEKGDGFALIGKVLNNQVLFSKDERQKLSAEFVRIRPMVEPTGQAIALTNIEGDWEFVLLPTAYKHDPGRLNGEAHNQSMTQLYSSPTPDISINVDEPAAVETVQPVSVPETLKPFIEWAIELQVDEEGWLSVAKTFEALPESLKVSYPDLMGFAKFLAKLNQLKAVDIKPGFEWFKLSDLVVEKVAENEAGDEAIELDPDVYSRLQNWMQTTGSKYFENGVIDVRSILTYFKAKGLKLDAIAARFYLSQLVEDGLGEWVLTDTQKFHLYFHS
ncbi:MAG: hypothetical protein KME11_12490 [Timaviella obliquedivisa GSE-PSE-MK23-08B]|nr:hypothetical protein [Timaviella obliquedivisa GSE-PSE-MK23-08B]